MVNRTWHPRERFDESEDKGRRDRGQEKYKTLQWAVAGTLDTAGRQKKRKKTSMVPDDAGGVEVIQTHTQRERRVKKSQKTKTKILDRTKRRRSSGVQIYRWLLRR